MVSCLAIAFVDGTESYSRSSLSREVYIYVIVEGVRSCYRGKKPGVVRFLPVRLFVVLSMHSVVDRNPLIIFRVTVSFISLQRLRDDDEKEQPQG